MPPQPHTTNDGRDLADRVFRELRADLLRVIRRRVKDVGASEDVLQDTLIKIQERAHSLRDDTRLDAWARRIAHNAAVDHLRRNRAEIPVESPPEPAPTTDDEGDNINAQVASWLRPMMGLLSAEDREALELVDIEGLGQTDLASRLSLSPSGARTRVQRARKRLAAALTDCCALERDARGNVLAFEHRKGCC